MDGKPQLQKQRARRLLSACACDHLFCLASSAVVFFPHYESITAATRTRMNSGLTLQRVITRKLTSTRLHSPFIHTSLFTSSPFNSTVKKFLHRKSFKDSSFHQGVSKVMQKRLCTRSTLKDVHLSKLESLRLKQTRILHFRFVL